MWFKPRLPVMETRITNLAQGLAGVRKTHAKISNFLPKLCPLLSTLTNTQTLWSDLTEYAGRDSASIKSQQFCRDEMLLVAVVGC